PFAQFVEQLQAGGVDHTPSALSHATQAAVRLYDAAGRGAEVPAAARKHVADFALWSDKNAVEFKQAGPKAAAVEAATRPGKLQTAQGVQDIRDKSFEGRQATRDAAEQRRHERNVGEGLSKEHREFQRQMTEKSATVIPAAS